MGADWEFELDEVDKASVGSSSVGSTPDINADDVHRRIMFDQEDEVEWERQLNLTVKTHPPRIATMQKFSAKKRTKAVAIETPRNPACSKFRAGKGIAYPKTPMWGNRSHATPGPKTGPIFPFDGRDRAVTTVHPLRKMQRFVKGAKDLKSLNKDFMSAGKKHQGIGEKAGKTSFGHQLGMTIERSSFLGF